MNFALMGGYYFWTATDLDHGGRTACMAYGAYLPRRQQWTRLWNIKQLPPKWRYQGAQPWPTRSCQPFSRSVRSTRTARCQPVALESAVTPSCHFTALAGMQVRSRGPSSRTLHIYICNRCSWMCGPCSSTEAYGLRHRCDNHHGAVGVGR